MQIVILRKKVWRFVSVIAVAIMCIMFDAVCHAGQLTFEPPSSAVHREISTVARSWMKALLRRDFETLAALSIAEDQPGMRNGLSNRGSKLYKALYAAKTSPYRKFANIKNFEVAVLTHNNLRSVGHGTTACFFDSLNPPSMWPSDFALLAPIMKQGDVYCIFLFRSDERWNVSTDFAGE